MRLPSHEGSPGLFENAAPDTLKHRSVRGAAVTMAAQLARFAIQFGSQIAMARLLDPADFGLVAMAAPVLALVQLFNDFGLSQAIVQRPKIDRADLSALFWINVGVSTGLCLLLILASPLVGLLYHEPRTVGITIALAFLVIIGGLFSQQTALLSRAMRFRHLAMIDVGSMAAATLAGIASALLGLGYWSLVAMPYAATFTMLILSWSFAGWLPYGPSGKRNVTGMIRFGGNVTGANLLNFLSRNLDNILIGKVYGTEILGLYDRAYKLMMLPIAQLNIPVSRIAIPLLSRLQDDPQRYRRAYLQLLQAIHLVALPGMLCAIALPGQLVLVLFGAKWAGVAPILFWLAIAGLTSFVGNSMGWLFVSQNKVRTQFRWSCVSAVLFVSSFLVGLPYGAVGVARVYAIVGVGIQGPIGWYVGTRTGPVSLRDLLATLLPFTFAGGVTFATLWLCNHYHPLAGIAGLMVAGALSYAVFALALAVLPAGRSILRNALSVRTMLRRRT